jgi:hypothetical protein
VPIVDGGTRGTGQVCNELVANDTWGVVRAEVESTYPARRRNSYEPIECQNARGEAKTISIKDDNRKKFRRPAAVEALSIAARVSAAM